MTADEEFDAAVATALETLSSSRLPEPTWPDVFTGWLSRINPTTLWSAEAGVNAAAIAKNLASSIRALMETKSLSTDEEKTRFANTILVMQAAYMDARNRALKSTSARYVITEKLRGQTQTLLLAQKKIKASTAAMTKLGDAVDGLAALITALK
ncbi:hypothetical protein [Agrobacterium rosae]|uniref:hypothetical protein n=1 Tax=Agrobacterium rosae TaxID=1972867 RepID=UPI002033F608|nr:hypothetical protein [Agrobacterium rosae]MCM2435824.1 hypothetical protein [Agrobacterium rosae]